MDKIVIEVEDLTKVSDGYHTLEELYEHRNLLFVNLALEVKDRYDVYYKLDEDVDGWFILYVELPTGQISYHLPDNYLDYMTDIPSIPVTKKWDGHTSEEVQRRLHKNLTEMVNCFDCKYYYDDLVQPGVGQCMNDNVPRDKVRQFETCSKGEKDV